MERIPVAVLIWVAMWCQTTVQGTFSLKTCVPSSTVSVIWAFHVTNFMIYVAIMTLLTILAWLTWLHARAMKAFETIFTTCDTFWRSCPLALSCFWWRCWPIVNSDDEPLLSNNCWNSWMVKIVPSGSLQLSSKANKWIILVTNALISTDDITNYKILHVIKCPSILVAIDTTRKGCFEELVDSGRKGNMVVTSSMFIVLLESTVLILWGLHCYCLTISLASHSWITALGYIMVVPLWVTSY